MGKKKKQLNIPIKGTKIAIKPKWQHILLIIVLGVIVYSNTLNNEFLYDDIDNIVQNNFIRSWNNLPNLFSNKYFTLAQEKTYRPIVTLSYFINYSISKLNVIGWHIINILLHLINGILIYFLIILITRNFKIAILTSIMFIVHPINTEVVNLACFREDSISLIFFLLSFIYFIKNIQEERKKKVFYILSVIWFFISIYTKEMALTLPFVLMLYEYYFNNKENAKPINFITNKLKATRYWGYYTIIIFFFLQRTYLLKPVGYVMGHDITLPTKTVGGDIVSTILTMIVTYVKYIKLSLFPSELSVQHVVGRHTGIDLWVTCSIIIIIAILYYAFKVKERPKIISFSILYFFLSLLPVSNIIPIGATMAERYLYFPIIGYCLLLSWATIQLSEKRNNKMVIPGVSFKILFIIIICFYSARTYIRNYDFKDTMTLWNNIIQQNPNSEKAFTNRGKEYFGKGEHDKAINDFNKVLEINPRSVFAYNNRGITYNNKKMYNEAIADYNKAIELNPGYMLSYFNRGNAYKNINLLNKALKDYDKTTELNPMFAAAYTQKGIIYEKTGYYDRAIPAFSKALEINSVDMEALNNRGVAYGKKKEYKKSIEDFNKILKQNPEDIDAYRNKAITYYKQGITDKAIVVINKAIKLDPSNKTLYQYRDIFNKNTIE